MGTSHETVVVFEELERGHVTIAQYPDEPYSYPITSKAAKALKDAKKGDKIEVVWDYDSDSYPIIAARRITGTLEDRVARLEAALAAAGIPIPEEAP